MTDVEVLENELEKMYDEVCRLRKKPKDPYVHDLEQEIEALEMEISNLRSLLTWRDVREKPEENDLYICKFHDNGESKIYMDTYEWKNGKWIVDYDEIIVGWLPIPKE